MVTLLFVGCSGGAGKNTSDNSTAAASDGGSGDDMYYEYTSHTVGSGITLNSSNKIFLSSGGKVRKEMMMSNSAKPDKSSPIVTIGSVEKPGESIFIDDDKKTYSVNHPGDSLGAGGTGIKTTSTVSKAGEEKILGFNCVHARIISTKDLVFTKDVDTIDLWKSGDVPLLPAYRKSMESFESKTGNFMYEPGVTDQLRQMGCEGFLVRMEVKGKNLSSHTELTKVEKRDIPKSMFEIPPGYTEDKNGGF